jgi:hypothetical protein
MIGDSFGLEETVGSANSHDDDDRSSISGKTMMMRSNQASISETVCCDLLKAERADPLAGQWTVGSEDSRAASLSATPIPVVVPVRLFHSGQTAFSRIAIRLLFSESRVASDHFSSQWPLKY